MLKNLSGFNLQCKLTDFGVSRHPDGGVSLGGSRPWQAPECSRGAYYRIEAAKRTDIYSFGMLLWRVMFDGVSSCPSDDHLKHTVCGVPRHVITLSVYSMREC